MNDINDIPFVAVGNDELGRYVKKGDLLQKGKLKGCLKYGTDESGKESNVIGFVTVEDGTTYLAAIKDQLVFEWEKADE